MEDKRAHFWVRHFFAVNSVLGYHIVEIDLVVGAQHRDDKRFFLNEIRFLSV